MMTTLKLVYTLEQPHGPGEVYMEWQGGGALLATTGADGTLAIHDRHGQLLERMKLNGLCGCMSWDADGDLLAATTPSSNAVLLWEWRQNRRLSVETGLGEPPACLAWAPTEPLLAVGTKRGNLMLYNHHTTKRIPIIGKHSKKICCAAWNKDNILVLASEDKSLSVNNADGDTLRVISLRDLPSNLQFSEMKTDERVAGENTISLIVGKKNLFLYNLLDPENPIELAFQQKYGSIVSYRWYGDGYILIGFSDGYLIGISTHIKEVGQELFQVKNHKDSLTDVCVCSALGQAATCGDNQLRTVSVWNNAEVVSSTAPPGGAERCAWSSDGQLLAVTARSYLSVYIGSLPQLYGAYGTRIVALTGLTEATVYECINPDDTSKEPRALCTVSLQSEPHALCAGDAHVLCARDAHAWLVPLTQSRAPHPRTHAARVTKLQLSQHYAAVLAAGQLALYSIMGERDARADRDSITFPEPHMKSAKIVDMCITNDFLIYVTDLGHIMYFGLEEWSHAARGQHSCGLRSVHADIAGVRAVVVDARHRGHVYSPLADQLVLIEDLSHATKGVLWDICLTERNVFIAYTDECISTYYFSANSTRGSHVELIASTGLAASQVPLIFFSGDVYSYCTGGTVTKTPLSSHSTPGLCDADSERRVAQQNTHVRKLVRLRRFAEAWPYCVALDDPDVYRHAAEAAVDALHVEFAIQVYTMLNDVAMVWSLEDALHIEDIPTLCGALCGEGEGAARWLQAAGAGAALELHAARGEWGRAAQLAAAAAPHRLPHITRQHAAQLEFTADYHEALANYEKSIITENTDDPKVQQHNAVCEAGVARMAIRCGDIIRGVTLAMKRSDDTNLLKDCAQLLEEEKHFSHAAALHDHAGDIEKAATLYIKLKSWIKVEGLLPKINSPSVHIMYAKAKEAEGRYNDALKSYIKAQDYEAAIRLNLEKLNNSDEAVRLVQESKSIQGAKMVANYFQRYNDSSSAIKFLVMSLCYDEAFQLARKHGKLQLYGDILISVTSHTRPDDFRSLALHFEGEQNHLLAGKFYFHAKEYNRALAHLLKVSSVNEVDENEAITLAIDTVASSNDESLSRRLIEYLLGETDGNPKEPRYLFRLYMARKQFAEAAKTAIVIASHEQRSGNYRVARDVLLAMCQELRARGVGVARDMLQQLGLLHAYILARLHVRRQRHDLCARLLARVADNLDAFPAHIVPILTSTVIECSRAGLKHTAYKHARTLMRPELRSQIDEKYAKKIESVIRHAPKPGEREAQPVSPCPQCGAAAPSVELLCGACGIVMPFCIATGCHIVKDDLTACPECDFPAIKSEFVALVKEEGRCPMCWEGVDFRRLPVLEDVQPYLDIARKE